MITLRKPLAAVAAAFMALSLSVAPSFATSTDTVGDIKEKKSVANIGMSCTGTLIAPGWVLTAAHCFDGKGPTQLARQGYLTIGNTLDGTTVHYSEVFDNPHKDPVRGDTLDAALVKLDKMVDVEPIPLATEEPQRGDHLIALGWSRAVFNDHTTRLPGVSAYVMYNSPKGPRSLYRVEEGSTIGHGDSGGPMLNDKGEIVGVIVSGGGGCHPALWYPVAGK